MLKKAGAYYQDLRDRGLDFKRWIAGLGHGVLIQTPEANVKNLVKLIQSQKL
jgi:uroporphyrinogen-III decarboxylase